MHAAASCLCCEAKFSSHPIWEGSGSARNAISCHGKSDMCWLASSSHLRRKFDVLMEEERNRLVYGRRFGQRYRVGLVFFQGARRCSIACVTSDRGADTTLILRSSCSSGTERPPRAVVNLSKQIVVSTMSPVQSPSSENLPKLVNSAWESQLGGPCASGL